MRVYLDNCCFNRPFDEQSQTRVRLQAEAKLEIQQRIKDSKIELGWSYMIDYENRFNPFDDQQAAIAGWKRRAVVQVEESPAILREAHAIADRGLRQGDALHVSCAMAAGCEYFLTTDDLVVKRMRDFSGIIVMDPAQFVIEVT
jgi:hypothetical protein